MNKTALWVIIIVVILGLGWWWMGSSSQTPVNTTPVSTTGTAATNLTIANNAFAPATLTVKKGSTVTWTNSDSVPHTVTGDNGGPSSERLSNGQSYSYVFDTAGTFAYHCAVHPSMHGTVVVTE